VAKKEAARDPRFAPVGYLGRVAYIDRTDARQAVAALDGVVQRLKEGTSIVIAPEGTRSHTPKLGPFKKGAFHMAVQGGVPIVPIVIRNAGEIMWKGSVLIRSGTIDVEVLAPIPTDDWKISQLSARVAEVRQLYLDVFAKWAGENGAAGTPE
jgi:putative phosphoserine phosphatase/1-acylglycerol-3-phosphate O-acyltransferase